VNSAYRFVSRPVSWLVPVLLLLLVGPAAAQFAQIRIPTAGDVLTGPTVVAARQLTTSIAPSQVSSVRFEYSGDGTTWNLITIVDISAIGQDLHSPLDWDTVWDPVMVAPGSYRLRSRFYLKNGLILSTPAVGVTVHHPPIALATGTISPALTAVFDGSSASSTDGFIVSWDWNFGDGVTGTGSTVSHSYAPGQSVTASLTVTDNFGTKASSYFDVSTIGAPTIGQSTKCIATRIRLRGEDAEPLIAGGKKGIAFGEDGKGRAWRQSPGHEGQTLGRLAGRPNPANQALGLLYAGYAFEIVVDVDGDPVACTEIQLVQANYSSAPQAFTEEECKAMPQAVYRNDKTCVYDATWKGLTNDFDMDGALDLDVSTQAKCENRPPDGYNGKWVDRKCLAPFRAEGGLNGYKPDEAEQDKDATGNLPPGRATRRDYNKSSGGMLQESILSMTHQAIGSSHRWCVGLIRSTATPTSTYR